MINYQELYQYRQIKHNQMLESLFHHLNDDLKAKERRKLNLKIKF